jgi:hypothetical protein
MSKIFVPILIAVLIFAVSCQDSSNLTDPTGQGSLMIPLDLTSVGDFVWNDINMDGIQDTSEFGIADVVVNLYTCEDTMIATTTTDVDGIYEFVELEAGDYYLEFELPDGYVFTLMDQGNDDEFDSDVDPETWLTDCFTLEDDIPNMTVDAGMYMEDDNNCTRSKGYWKNHAGLGPQPDYVTDLLPIWLGEDDGTLSYEVTTAEMAVDFMQQHTYGHPSNGITKLYAQLLAAKLNIANGADDEDIADTIAEADDFLGEYNWESWDDLDGEDRDAVMGWKGMLGDYNSGDIGPGSCDELDVMW